MTYTIHHAKEPFHSINYSGPGISVGREPVDITQYQNTYLISARLLRCLCMLPFHDVALDDVEHPRRRTKYGHLLVQNLTLITIENHI